MKHPYSNRIIVGALLLTGLLGPGLGAPAAFAQTDTERLAHARWAWRIHDGEVTLERRPEFVYLVGNAETSHWLTSMREPVSVAAPSVLYELVPELGFEHNKCQDTGDVIFCLPDPPCPGPLLCPPFPVPTVETGRSGKLHGGELTWRRQGDRVRLSSNTRDVFWVIDRGSRARMLFPDQSLEAKAPVSIYRFLGLGQFDTDFIPRSRLPEGLIFQPCADRHPGDGLCATEETSE